MNILVAALYRFAPVTDLPEKAASLREVAEAGQVRGTVIMAPEGINGTIAGPEGGVTAFIRHISSWAGFEELTPRFSHIDEQPFGRLKIRLKREIVTMGVPETDPLAHIGRYVSPTDWNALLMANDVAIIDTRNDYEVGIGTFRNAINPETKSFREFPQWWQDNAARFEGKRIAMFCTGGIRCEKSTSYLVSQGVEEVYHLQGGILNYLEHMDPENSLWDGGCFVFDDRVALGHGLEPTGHSKCHACRRPLTDDDRQHPSFEEGASCHHCIEEFTDADRARFRERERQINLAQARGTHHMGTD